MAFASFDQLKDAKKEIETLTHHYPNKKGLFHPQLPRPLQRLLRLFIPKMPL
jgi:hypothetical protein